MKKAIKTIVLCFCLCAVLAGCSGNSKATYTLTPDSGENFSVTMKTGKDYEAANPTDSAVVVLDKDGSPVATVHMISKSAYDSYKTAASTLPSYKMLKQDGMEGFSYSSVNNSDGSVRVYARCYAVTDNTAIYMEADDSDDTLNTVFGMMNVKKK